LNDARQTFTSSLRRHREQHGISLSAIAKTTKISAGFLDALERSDLSRWPKGIFRRAFFREYVVAIGLSPEPFVSEFARLFPDDPGVPVSDDPPSEFRMVLAVGESAAPAATLKRATVVIAELAAIVTIACAGAWLLNVDLWSAIGVAALVYYPISNLCIERRLRLRSLRALVDEPLLTRSSHKRRHEDVEGHEELQVSF
jgi:transcriptional regulator with XRE-family HTH domain